MSDMPKYEMSSSDMGGFVGFVLMIILIGIIVSGINAERRHDRQIKEWDSMVSDWTVEATEVLGESFLAERMVSCDKGSGRSWRRYTGSHLAPVTVTPVRRTFQSGRVEVGEQLDNMPPSYVRCSWRDSEFRAEQENP